MAVTLRALLVGIELTSIDFRASQVRVGRVLLQSVGWAAVRTSAKECLCNRVDIQGLAGHTTAGECDGYRLGLAIPG